MNITTNLGLKTYDVLGTDAQVNIMQGFDDVFGEKLGSNMNIIDLSYKNLDDKINAVETNVTENLEQDIADLGNTKANKVDVYTKDETYNRTEIDGKVSAVYRYKGTKNTYEELLLTTGMIVGDVWDVLFDGKNYAWDGTQWDSLAGIVDVSALATKEALAVTDGKVSALETDVDNLETNKANKTDVNTSLSTKVDKVSGKELSTNDLTDALKAKYDGYETNKENAFIKNTAFNKNFGNTASTVCEGDDSRLSNSRPASDVFDWAKQSTKPTYTASEVGALPSDTELGNATSIQGKPVSNLAPVDGQTLVYSELTDSYELLKYNSSGGDGVKYYRMGGF